LYAITPQMHPDSRGLLRAVCAALEGGAAVIQFRDKSADEAWRLDTATHIAGLCREAGVPLIVNDDAELARASGAAGVHIGRDDGEVRDVRGRLGPDLLIGVSCYDDLERAAEAVRAGADYLAFGSMYSSGSKPSAVRCGREVLGAAGALGKPLVAIGGITPENGAPVIAAGADFLAVIDGVFGAADIRGVARRFAGLWSP